MTGPLTGVRILDLTHVWAGPLAVRFLSDLGAEVVKVEAPYGRGPRELPYEPLGGWVGGEPGEDSWNRNAIFTKQHRNRKSLCLDLKQNQGREVFLSLVRVADIVIENFSARAMPAMNLDYETLNAVNPNIIYITMPGFGTTGPYRERIAFGPTVEPMSGLTSMLGYGPDEPRNSAIALMDPICATNAAAAVTHALRIREREGTGSRVELSLHEGGVSYSGPWLLDIQLEQPPVSVGNRHPSMAPHGVYPCQGEDAWIVVACPDTDTWQRLGKLIDCNIGSTNLDARIQQADTIDTAIENWSCRFSPLEATELLQQAGVPAGPVNTTPEMTADPQAVAREFFVPFERFGTPMPGSPLHMRGINRDEWTPCPGLGEHNAEVLSDWLSMAEEEIDLLHQKHVIFDSPPA